MNLDVNILRVHGFPNLRTLKALFGFLIVFFVLLLLRNAWVSDDAYITFRTVFNFTHGHGPSYNLDERVQNFTNPLWMLLMSLFYLVTGEAYFTSIIFSIILTLGTSIVLVGRIQEWKFEGVLTLVFLMLSKAFMDFSTSGLENPLTHFLIAIFAWIYLRYDWNAKKVLWLSLLTGLAVLNRMDTLLLFAPALVFAFWKARSFKSIGFAALGFLPFILWEVFAIIYYGFPFPNTAYAKLNTGIPGVELAAQGFYYLVNSLDWDPFSLLLIITSLVLVVQKRNWPLFPLAIGTLLYLFYVIKIGGDFMSGRFIAAPFLMGVILFSQVKPKAISGLLVGIILISTGLFNPSSPVYTHSGYQSPTGKKIDSRGIADERWWYEDATGFIKSNRRMDINEVEARLDQSMEVSDELTVLFFDMIGFVGYQVGPSMHVMDRWALADPLLARLPIIYDKDWRIGHFTRDIPHGYLQTLRTGKNSLENKDLAKFYDHLCVATKSPVWAKGRMAEIWKLNTGQYDKLIDRKYFSDPGLDKVTLSQLSVRKEIGSDWNGPGNIVIRPFRTLTIDLERMYYSREMEFSADNNDTYEFYFLKKGTEVGQKIVYPAYIDVGGLNVYRVDIPQDVYEAGYDKIVVKGDGGDDYYSIGHLILIGY